MDWTDRHARVFHRQLTRRALLYTEMVTADAIIHGDRERLLGFSECEHPLGLQLGGSDPAKLAEAADHHPDIDIRWRKVTLKFVTHDAGNAITELDARLAKEAMESVVGTSAKATAAE